MVGLLTPNFSNQFNFMCDASFSFEMQPLISKVIPTTILKVISPGQ